MKLFLKTATAALFLGMLFACASPPPAAETVDEGIVEADPPTRVVEQEAAAAPTEKPADEVDPAELEAEAVEAEAVMEEEEMEEEAPAAEPVEVATDGPTHTPAASVQEAIIERAYDQAKGASAEDALLTVIEYGDFQ